MPNDLPPWSAVYQQMRRWIEAGCFEALVADVQSLLRELGGRKGQPTTVLIWTAARCSRRPRAVLAPATMGPSGARDRRSTSRSIRWGICWR